MTTPAQRFAEALSLCPTDLLTPDQPAAMLDLSHRTLAVWRSNRRNPLPYVKLGSRVRYRRQDVAAWLESQTHTGRGQGMKGDHNRPARLPCRPAPA